VAGQDSLAGVPGWEAVGQDSNLVGAGCANQKLEASKEQLPKTATAEKSQSGSTANLPTPSP